MRLATTALALAMLTLGAACATTGGGERSGPGGNTLESAEIQEAGAHIRTAFEAVQHLRPQFLRVRANPTVQGRSVDPVRVYVNGVLRGEVRSLESIRVEEVVRIRFIRPSDAQQRYGLNHGSGAIEVTTVGR